MAQTQELYTGDGTTKNFTFPFEYIKEADIKVSLNGSDTTEFTFANATTIQFNVAPPDGAAIRIYRVTDIDNAVATFFSGSSIRAQDLNNNADQLLYATQMLLSPPFVVDYVHSQDSRSCFTLSVWC